MSKIGTCKTEYHDNRTKDQEEYGTIPIIAEPLCCGKGDNKVEAACFKADISDIKKYALAQRGAVV